jgi:CRISPR-associated protein Cmr4
MSNYLSYLYLLSPLHTGGSAQEGNLLGIARESHTELPYLPSSTIRGRFRATTSDTDCKVLWGNTIDDVKQGDDNLTQGDLWVGDGAMLWFPVPSLSHGVVWISCPFILQRWARLTGKQLTIPEEGSFSGGNQKPLYLRDAIFKPGELKPWSKEQWSHFIPSGSDETKIINSVLILSLPNYQALVQSSLWRQVRVKLDAKKNTDGGFRYEEAIPPETLMFFPWGSTASANGTGKSSCQKFTEMLDQQKIWQIGGQESLGRGFVELWSSNNS